MFNRDVPHGPRMRTAPTNMAALLMATGLGLGQQPNDAASHTQVAAHRGHLERYHAALSLTSNSREDALENIAKTSDDEVATLAATALIKLQSERAGTVSTRLIVSLSEPKLLDVHLRQIIGRAASTRNIPLRLALARVTLERIAAEQPTAKAGNRAGDAEGAAGVAAIALSDSPDKPDRALIGRVARIRPHDYRVWYALAKIGDASAENLALARSVMQDAQL